MPHLANEWKEQVLACPFYKFNSVRYMSCVRLRLSRIRDVKQHLMRRHRRPTYCPVCGEIFNDSGRCDSHITARTCYPPPGGVNIEGVTETQSVALTRRVDRTLDASSQWFSVWDILFPDRCRPQSPYLSLTHFGELLSIFHNYWEHQRDTLIAQAIQSTAGGGGGHSPLSPLMAELSSEIVENLFSTFRATSHTIMGPASSKTAGNATVLGPDEFQSSPGLLEDAGRPPATSNVLSNPPRVDTGFIPPLRCSLDVDVPLALPAIQVPEPLEISCTPTWPNNDLDLQFTDVDFSSCDPALASSDLPGMHWVNPHPGTAIDPGVPLELYPLYGFGFPGGVPTPPLDDQ